MCGRVDGDDESKATFERCDCDDPGEFDCQSRSDVDASSEFFEAVFLFGAREAASSGGASAHIDESSIRSPWTGNSRLLNSA